MNSPQRVLLKISGESLKGLDYNNRYDETILKNIAQDISEVSAQGIQICLVVGGGNICRGKNITNLGINRVQADYTGMLSTIINALVLQGIMEKIGLKVAVLSSIPIDNVCESYTNKRAYEYLEKGYIVIFAGGINNPLVSTDTVAVFRSIEMKCDLLLKGTLVDGVYSADPKKFVNAKKFDTITYREILIKNLQIMDTVAIALAREHNLYINIFNINEARNFVKVVNNQGNFTKIYEI